MKTLILALVLTILLCSCSDNPVNNSNNPPPVSNDSLIFTTDSQTVFGNSNQFIINYFNDINECNFKNFKAVMQFETNCPDTSGGFQLYLVNINNNSQFYNFYKLGNEANYNAIHTFTFNYSNPTLIRFVIAFGFTHQIVNNYFVRLKIFKLYKIS